MTPPRTPPPARRAPLFAAITLLASAAAAHAGEVSVAAVAEDLLEVRWLDGRAQMATLGSGVDGEIVDLGALDTAAADKTGTWAVAGGPAVVAVGRKSKGAAFARVAEWDIASALGHQIYLRLEAPLEPGRDYALEAPALRLKERFTYGADSSPPTPVLQLNQAGYLPALPKFAYASLWTGTGGPLDLAPYAGRGFRVLDAATGAEAFKGEPKLRWPRDRAEGAGGENLRRCDLWECDFSALTKPGRYVLEWPGLGRSRPFTVSADAYAAPYRTLMAGLHGQRCGCALDADHTPGPRPACHTGPVTLSAHRFTDGSNAFEALANKATNIKAPLPGGYHDAGDWDRHSGHLVVADALLLVFDAFPGRFPDGDLPLPEAGNGVPDIVDEARWGVDFFLRLQGDDGGVRGGVESTDHPKFGEASWTDSLPLYAYAPDPQASYRLAASAAALARTYARLRMDGLRDRYLSAAGRAWAWAEADPERATFPDERLHAAASLFAATGGGAYHDAFKRGLRVKAPGQPLESYGEYDQRWAVWTYMLCDRPEADAGAQAVLRKAAAAYADWLCIDTAARRGRRAGYNWWKPFGHGALTVPDNLALIAAHRAVGANKYLEQMALNADAPLGANALGVCWVTGLGDEPVRDVLHIDSWFSGKAAPAPGIVPYGPRRWEGVDSGWTHSFGMRTLHPDGADWPAEELWTANFMSPAAAEFTVWECTAPAAAAYAYLHAARQETGTRP